jgi:threonine dehydrogenase-like Zn-dependent dehydrogenase
MCRRGLFAQCETTQVREQGKGAALFGYTSLYGSVPGGQAEYLRVPQAQFGPVKVPEGAPDEQYLYLSDILPTAYQAVAYADVPDGGTLAVLGLGPVGQLAVRIGRCLGVRRVIGVDQVPERRAAAQRFGVETVDPDELDDVAATLIEAVDGRGPDAVIDAVGMEAHGHDEPRSTRLTELAQKATGLLPDAAAAKFSDKAALDRLDALHTAVKAVRRGGTVSVSGVYGGEIDPMPMMEMFDRGIQLRMGQAHVRRWINDLLPIVSNDSDPLGVRDFATHHLPLADAPRGYEMFRAKTDGCLKVVLRP